MRGGFKMAKAKKGVAFILVVITLLGVLSTAALGAKAGGVTKVTVKKFLGIPIGVTVYISHNDLQNWKKSIKNIPPGFVVPGLPTVAKVAIATVKYSASAYLWDWSKYDKGNGVKIVLPVFTPIAAFGGIPSSQ
jgi:hypothetical protein